jgi:hypothetical protein
MANQLRVAQIHSILTLYERGWICRRIARELGVDRETVGKYVGQARAPDGAKPAKAPTGSVPGPGWAGEPKPAKAPPGSAPPPEVEGIASSAGVASPGSLSGGDGTWPRTLSDCRPHHATILAKLAQGLSAVRIQQDLAAEHGAEAPSYHSVRRYVHRLT